MEVSKFSEEFTDRENRIIKLAVLMHDFGKPAAKTTEETGLDHFKRHPEISEEISAKVMRRLKLDNDTIDNVRKLIKWHDYRPKLTMPRVRRMMVKVGPERMKMYLKLRIADTLSQSEYNRKEKLKYLEELTLKYNKVIEDGDCLSIKELAVTGRDLIGIGVTPGPALGEILKELLEDVLDRPEHNTKEYLISRVEKRICETTED